MYTNADLNTCQYIRLHMKIICLIFHIKTSYIFYFLRYAHKRYVKILFTDFQKEHMLKISLLFKTFTNFKGK